MMNNALRLVRVYHDMSQTKAASELGLSKSYISEIESGRKKVSMETLERYSKTFNIPMSSLMLFSERLDNPDFPENARAFVADKALKMLDWIATISSNKKIA